MLNLTKAQDYREEPADFMREAGPAGLLLDADPDVNIRLTCLASPVQFEGTIDGYPIYFRSRWSSWELTVAKMGKNPVNAHRAVGDYLLYIGGEYDADGSGFGAGQMPLQVACNLLCSGVLALRQRNRSKDDEGTVNE
jgi:hypothetical protein